MGDVYKAGTRASTASMPFCPLPTLLPDSLLMEVSVDRRRFLKSSGTVALAPAVATTAAAANDPIRVAIIRCGGMGPHDLTHLHQQPRVAARPRPHPLPLAAP